MPRGHYGSSWEPSPETAHRLGRWRRGVAARWTVAEIAADLGLKPDTLAQYVIRARRAGHPDAVLHWNYVPAGEGVGHVLGQSVTLARRARLRAEGKIR